MAKSCVLIIENRVDASLLAPLQAQSTLCLTVSGGEAVKNLATYESLALRLIQEGIGSDCVIVACGGGATLDLAGFLAATYCRGVRLCFIPSTLLAMTDAAIGGKNGLDLHAIKNIIGTIYHPDLVIIDIDLLRSLPAVEMQNGLVEMAKHALLDNKASCDRFMKALPALKAKNKEALIAEIERSTSIKMRFVSEAILHPERRHLLNFGHTIGHAIESLEHFQCSHGQAVARGILVESYLAKLLSYLPESEYQYIEALIRALELPMRLASFPHEQWLQALQRDKKADQGRPRFVLPREVGRFVHEEGACVVEVPQEPLFQAIKNFE
ncbi:MAG: 3-dehydroquinate synthase [Verrucomicrobia bacterium]|nr:3-dehydroquinate synthase [Verrucomicrobiota bacterium]